MEQIDLTYYRNAVVGTRIGNQYIVPPMAYTLKLRHNRIPIYYYDMLNNFKKLPYCKNIYTKCCDEMDMAMCPKCVLDVPRTIVVKSRTILESWSPYNNKEFPPLLCKIEDYETIKKEIEHAWNKIIMIFN